MKTICTAFIMALLSFSLIAQSFKADIYINNGKAISTDFIRLSNGALFGSPFAATDQLGLDRIYAEKIDYIDAHIHDDNSFRFEVIPGRSFKLWTQVESISDQINIYINSIHNQVYLETISYSNFSNRNIIAYSKDNKRPKRILYRNLKNDLSDNFESKMYLNKVRNQTLIQIASYIAGSALVGFGVRETYLQAHGEVPLSISKITAFYLGGITGFVIPFVITPFKRDNLLNALKTY